MTVTSGAGEIISGYCLHLFYFLFGFFSITCNVLKTEVVAIPVTLAIEFDAYINAYGHQIKGIFVIDKEYNSVNINLSWAFDNKKLNRFLSMIPQ